jgi:hypothetical protein
MDAMRRFGCVHVSPQSVSPNHWRDAIRVDGVELFDELGTIEAPWQLTLDKLGPFIVDIDAAENNLFDAMDMRVAAAREAVLREMGVPLYYALLASAISRSMAMSSFSPYSSACSSSMKSLLCSAVFGHAGLPTPSQ